MNDKIKLLAECLRGANKACKDAQFETAGKEEIAYLAGELFNAELRCKASGEFGKTCPKCGAEMKKSKQDKWYCSDLCWKKENVS